MGWGAKLRPEDTDRQRDRSGCRGGSLPSGTRRGVLWMLRGALSSSLPGQAPLCSPASPCWGQTRMQAQHPLTALLWAAAPSLTPSSVARGRPLRARALLCSPPPATAPRPPPGTSNRGQAASFLPTLLLAHGNPASRAHATRATPPRVLSREAPLTPPPRPGPHRASLGRAWQVLSTGQGLVNGGRREGGRKYRRGGMEREAVRR